MSNEEKFKDVKDINGEQSTSLLKFQETDPIHEVVQEKINMAVDSIAIERELELEDEDTLIEKKKQELKKWFTHNYAHELNIRSNGIGGQSQGAMMNSMGNNENPNLAFQNLINIATSSEENKQN
mgnify:CR=1 FL=1